MSARTHGRSAAEKLGRLQVQNRRHLAELRQLRHDAARCAWQADVMPALDAEWHKQQYVHDLLAAPGPLALLRRAVGGPPVPAGWRWRKYWTVASGRLRERG